MIKVTCALIIQDGLILLTQRGNHPHHPFQWEFPGGKLQPGESEENCILREIREELNLEITILKKLKPVDFDYGFITIELIPFLCKIQSGIIMLSGHIAFKWIKWNEIKKENISGADKELLAEPINRKLIEKYSGEKINYPG
jgi:8-oxo-dGTP diphosphatase